jgi:glycosyltransferase involved in cell wall biosynthesis
MLVSVIIPTFNRAAMVGDAIESALRQTYARKEIIVVDDGSVDETAAVLAGFGDRIRVIRQSNAGAGAARNRAIDAARGELIAFLDSDDEWFDFKLELQVSVLQAMPQIDFLFTEFVVHRSSGEVLHGGARRWHDNQIDWQTLFASHQRFSSLGAPSLPAIPDFTIYSGSLYRHLLKHYLILPTTAIVRAAALDQVTRFAEGPIVFEDWEFFARLARSHRAAFADVETAVNRGHQTPGRLTMCSNLTKLSTHAAIIERVFEPDSNFMREHRQEVDSLKADLFARIAREALLGARPDLARAALRRRRQLKVASRRLDTTIYSVLSYAPGGSGAMRLARQTVRLARTISGRA